MKNFLVGALTIFALAGTYAYAHADGDVLACAKKNGALYLIGSGFKREDSKSNETLISWSAGTHTKSLRLVDSNGNDFGRLLNAMGPANATTYFEDADIVVSIDGGQVGAPIYDAGFPFFDNPECAGAIYASDIPRIGSLVMVAADTAAPFYRIDGVATRMQAYTRSGEACVSLGETTLVPAIQVDLPSYFSERALPFRVVAE